MMEKNEQRYILQLPRTSISIRRREEQDVLLFEDHHNHIFPCCVVSDSNHQGSKEEQSEPGNNIHLILPNVRRKRRNQSLSIIIPMFLIRSFDSSTTHREAQSCHGFYISPYGSIYVHTEDCCKAMKIGIIVSNIRLGQESNACTP